MTRRVALASTIVTAFTPGLRAAAATRPDARAQIEAIERENGGRLGVAILDTATGARLAHRGDERFAMCSTFKCLTAAHVLARVDRGQESLDRRIMYSARDILPHSPITKRHVADGLTVGELCEATMTVSDNAAANLLLASFGGPPGFTAYARSLGDGVTRLDRVEPELNDWKAGEVRDTTTPNAMLDDLRKVALGDALSRASRDALVGWLVANKTGDKRLRAGVPRNWRVGDKTGTSGSGIFNDIAVLWPPDRAPLVVTAYYSEASGPDEKCNAVIAEVGASAARWIAG
jgi:beta-lactamase class A